jgi:OmpA-OmpF porin, OOP family
MKLYTLASIIFLTLSACGTADIATVRNGVSSGDNFDRALFERYRKLALFEHDEMSDWNDAIYFAKRGIKAGAGVTPEATDLRQWFLSDDETARLSAAREHLLDLLERGARDGFPETAAEAQTSFDCWVEQIEEGHQRNHIDACQQDFRVATATLEEQLGPQSFNMFFEHDSDELKPQSRKTIVNALRRLAPAKMVIVGHADTAGGRSYNRDLSKRRADAVRKALISSGADPQRINLKTVGETKPFFKTADGVRLPQNRRVVIKALGLPKNISVASE